MSSITDLYRRRQTTSLATCTPPPVVCSTCGTLECVCRPRFFAGQVLNADDLNRLDAYIRAKHRLHNRQLHGWGVVNGLEVTCNPCGDGVTVSCGYALSPCGEDIVVCDAVTVDICDLINQCTEVLPPCDPPSPNRDPATGCDAAEQDWVLTIRYSESAARGVKPLYPTKSSDCGCGGGCQCKSGGSSKGSCGCGGGSTSSAGGCGCGSAAKSGTATKPRSAPVQCEPTVICEGFCFELYRVPPEQNDDKEDALSESPLIRRFECCVRELISKAPKQPQVTIGQDPGAWYLYGLRLKEFLVRYLQSKPGYNCDLITRLSTLAIPDPRTAAGAAAYGQTMEVLLAVVVDALLACLCSALLPPCPEPTNDVRVPIAVLHVSSKPCRVMRVCNWTVYRKFATTFPALQYWLSIVSIMRTLREGLQKLCCFDVMASLQPPADPRADALNIRAAAAAPAGAAGAPPPAAEPANNINEQMTMRLNPTLQDPEKVHDLASLVGQTLFSQRSPLTARGLVEALTGAKRSDGAPTDLQAAQLPQFLLLQELIKPVSDAAGAPAMTRMLGASLFAPRDSPSASDVDGLRAELESLKQTVASQSEAITQLKARRKR